MKGQALGHKWKYTNKHKVTIMRLLEEASDNLKVELSNYYRAERKFNKSNDLFWFKTMEIRRSMIGSYASTVYRLKVELLHRFDLNLFIPKTIKEYIRVEIDEATEEEQVEGIKQRIVFGGTYITEYKSYSRPCKKIIQKDGFGNVYYGNKFKMMNIDTLKPKEALNILKGIQWG